MHLYGVWLAVYALYKENTIKNIPQNTTSFMETSSYQSRVDRKVLVERRNFELPLETGSVHICIYIYTYIYI